MDAAEGGPPDPPDPKSALDGLTKYLPTETITLYIAWVSANKPLVAVFPFCTPKFGYGLFLVLTPVFLLLGYLATKKTTPVGTPLPKRPHWKMFAATVAFAVWALAVPDNGLIDKSDGNLPVVAAFGALLISTILNRIAVFFE